MLPRFYRSIVVGCALSWFLVGLYLPAVHQITHHDRAPSWPVVIAMSILAVAAVGGLWVLLRVTRPVAD